MSVSTAFVGAAAAALGVSTITAAATSAIYARKSWRAVAGEPDVDGDDGLLGEVAEVHARVDVLESEVGVRTRRAVPDGGEAS